MTDDWHLASDTRPEALPSMFMARVGHTISGSSLQGAGWRVLRCRIGMRKTAIQNAKGTLRMVRRSGASSVAPTSTAQLRLVLSLMR